MTSPTSWSCHPTEQALAEDSYAERTTAVIELARRSLLLRLCAHLMDRF